eukprot:221601-Pleurochrysis_carterae.AAC.1
MMKFPSYILKKAITRLNKCALRVMQACTPLLPNRAVMRIMASFPLAAVTRDHGGPGIRQ